MKKSLDKKIIYCSLDIETSDFTAEKGEVLEVGMVFFEIEKKKIKILSEWESTFKASKEVSPKILALTGITLEELEDAPLFRDKSEEIQTLVKDAVIVGHNINFDIKFLENFGIKFSGKSIDTLDLAQMFLPTQTSYNLEALMHLFKVSHQDAHRALADAKAALVVFEKLMAHYASFPERLRHELVKFFSVPGFTSMQDLLSTDFKALPFAPVQRKTDLKADKAFAKKLINPNEIFTFPLGFDYYSLVLGSLKNFKDKVLLVVPQKKIVYELWQEGLAAPVFNTQDLFNPAGFAKQLKKSLSREQRLFFAKMLVWQETNWQKEVLLDLNFSFSGNQFRSQLSFDRKQKKDISLPKRDKVVVCDYGDFINFELEKEYADRKVIILDLNNFEQALTALTSKKVSWSDFIYSLKQIYDPINEYGKKEYADIILDLLSQTDLFFGVASLSVKKIESNSSNVLVNKELENNENFISIVKAAESFADKVEQANKKLKSDKLETLIESLRAFLKEQPNIVRWMEFYGDRFTFATSPLDLSQIAQNKLTHYPNISFTASLGSEQLINYFTDRLNIKGFEVVPISQQQELRKKFEVILPQAGTAPFFESSDLLPLLEKTNYPVAVLLPSAGAVMGFYETHFKELQKRYKVSAQGFSGGTTKLLENFSIHENSLLLATDHFVLKQINRKLKVKTLIITRLPFDQFNHPLFAAQAEKYANQFMDFNIPRALYNFHSLIRFFYGPDLEKVYIQDQKISKEYGKYFIEYLKSLPFVVLK